MNSRVLPPELIRTIRAYSKPCLRYPKLYKDVLKALKMKRWPELGRKLCVKNPPILLILKVFLDANTNLLRGRQVLGNDRSSDLDEMYKLLRSMYDSAHHAMLLSVYGKPDN
jgi:hypothetical protein